MFKALLLVLVFGITTTCLGCTTSLGETTCQRITPDTSIDVQQPKRWYYCRSGDNNKYCMLDIAPISENTHTSTITYIDMETNRPMKLSYNLEEQEKKGLYLYVAQKIYGTVAAVTEDKQCFGFLKCTADKSSVVYLFLCSEPEQCKDERHKHFLEEQVKKTEGVIPFDKMRNSYETCKAAGIF